MLIQMAPFFCKVLVRRFSAHIRIPHCFDPGLTVDVHVLQSADSISDWINTNMKDCDLSDEHNDKIDLTNRELYREIPVIGVDIEWLSRGTYQSKTSLIQIAHKNSVMLVQTKFLRDQLPLSLIQLLRSRSVLKVGVGIKDDYIKLGKE